MRLLYLTYKVADDDTLVGFVSGWLRGLAPQVEAIEVICLATGAANLPPNVHVHSLGKERGLSRWRRAFNFAKTLWQLRSKVDTVLCQFSPEYVLAVAPLAKLKGWPIALWYTHRQVSGRLRVATFLADRVFTASPESFRLPTPKLRVIGHGIDVDRFSPTPQPPFETKTILAVGRRSPIKNYELLIDAVRVLIQEHQFKNVRVRIVGGDEGNAPPNYAADLQRRIDGYGLGSVITLVGPVPYNQVLHEYQQAALHVNLCPTGGLDKAVLEGLATGLPTLVRNETFRPVFSDQADQLVVNSSDPQVVAERLETLLTLSTTQYQHLSHTLRQRVVTQFSQATLVQRLVNELQLLQ